jgi:hypothetical protein
VSTIPAYGPLGKLLPWPLASCNTINIFDHAHIFTGVLNCIRALGGYTYASSADTVFDTEGFKEREYREQVEKTSGNLPLVMNWFVVLNLTLVKQLTICQVQRLQGKIGMLAGDLSYTQSARSWAITAWATLRKQPVLDFSCIRHETSTLSELQSSTIHSRLNHCG